MGEEVHQADIAASFQAAVTDVLVGKTMQAAQDYGIRRIAMAGGVSANTAIRKAMQEACDVKGYVLSVPAISLCTDNAAMIGSAAYDSYVKGIFAGPALNAEPDLPMRRL